ncbi:MAG: hypothetical protein IK142_07635 [Clostridiales bacterium]|nr:hypothetical protein [Clostridiales bacterium]
MVVAASVCAFQWLNAHAAATPLSDKTQNEPELSQPVASVGCAKQALQLVGSFCYINAAGVRVMPDV